MGVPLKRSLRGESLAEAQGRRADDRGGNYVLRKTSGGWKVAVLVAHDPGAVRKLD
jgi:hypothetical protein